MSVAWIAVLLLAPVLLALGLAAYGVALYNGLVEVKHQVDQAWANIDVLLKQRHDELPKLVDAVQGYMAHERTLLENVATLRTRASTAGSGDQRLIAEASLSQGVSRLLAVAENYPQLRASASFVELQRRISALEEQIAHRREFYNAAVNLNNVRMEQFPDSLFATLARMARRPSFENPTNVHASPDRLP